MALYLIDEDSFEFVATNDAEAKGSAAQFGTVKLSDDPAEDGTAAQGMAASQKALNETAYGKDETMSAPYSAGNNVFFRRLPGFVIVKADIYLTSTFTETQEALNLGTLPADFRPQQSIVLEIFIDHTAKMYLTIDTTGAVKILNDSEQTVASGKWLRANGVYPLARP